MNSLHRQAIDRLAEGLVVEATAPDGTIEAVSVRDAAGFALGVQWHPEYWVETDRLAQLFAAFGEAVRRYRAAAGLHKEGRRRGCGDAPRAPRPSRPVKHQRPDAAAPSRWTVSGRQPPGCPASLAMVIHRSRFRFRRTGEMRRSWPEGDLMHETSSGRAP